ncbi:MAG TPA: GNAT family N-acetyltransferase [Rubricoccaceae bacterium]|jgi:RimJ/RimL family protein N-acetyltransferase
MRLVLLDAALASALHGDAEGFEAAYGAAPADAAFVRGVVEQTLAMPADPPWGGYLAADGATVIGTCSFKGAPGPDDAVEIAHFTFPPFEGHGSATAMARELVALAVGSPGVRCVLAHTLPEPNASTRVLQRVGFVGDVVDPEDRPVWRRALSSMTGLTRIRPGPLGRLDSAGPLPFRPQRFRAHSPVENHL